MNKVIEIKELSKSFGDIKAVQGISFSVEKGSLFAFLGVNGAGKSTTISMICGQLKRDGGEIFIDGKTLAENADHIKRSLGVVYQTSVLDKPLTVKENLEYRASLYGMFGQELEDRIDEVCRLLDMSDILNRPYGKLSGGQKRKADIARAIIHRPKILILDEPTTGLDPQTRKKVWEVISHLQKNEGLTVFLTTHYMEEAADADRVVILDKGIIVAEGTPIELKNKFTGDFITLYGKTQEDIAELGLPCETIPGGIRIKFENIAEATKLITEYPYLFTDYEIHKGKMDDVFLAATGRTLDNEADEKDAKKGGANK